MRARRFGLGLALFCATACGGGKGGGLETCSPAASYPAGIVHGPLVGFVTPAAPTIAWASEVAGRGAVEYGPTTAYGAVAEESGAASADHHVALAGLAPGSTVHYRLLLDGAPLGPDHALRTPPPAGDPSPVRFTVVGDTGTGCAPELKVLGVVDATNPDFVLVTGDVAYKDGTSKQVRDGFLIPFAPLAARLPVFPTLGNHDVKTAGGGALFHLLDLPTNSARGTEDFYAFDWGDVHVVCLNSNVERTPASAQTPWLEADLAASKARWKVVFFHHPAYSSSRHGGSEMVDTTWVPVFDAHHVDLVFNGHDHDYERTHPLVGGKPTDATGGPAYRDPAGTVYVVTGGGGADLYPAGKSAFTAVSASVHHAVEVEVSGTTLTLQAVGDDGKPFDLISITKTK